MTMATKTSHTSEQVVRKLAQADRLRTARVKSSRS
jgi:hypothetical protein